MAMEVFRIPIMLIPEQRCGVTALFRTESCFIKFPVELLSQPRLLRIMIDKAYWSCLGKKALPELEKRTAELNCRYFGFVFHKVRFHRQFRRWGSCSSLKNINISHRLIGGPQQLMDYIILHELAHLKYLNHRKEFWTLVKSTGVNPAAIKKDIIAYGQQWQSEYQVWYKQIYAKGGKLF